MASLDGWRLALVTRLRRAALAAKVLDEQVKWGHLVYFCNGPALLIRAEDHRVIFGFWRGKRLRDLDDRLRPGGKYEMASIKFAQGEGISTAKAKELVAAAIALNAELGDPRG